jgi:hypothetical protein
VQPSWFSFLAENGLCESTKKKPSPENQRGLENSYPKNRDQKLSTSRTLRPLYVPQEGQAMWDGMVAPQSEHELKFGAFQRLAPRRIF